MPCNSKANFVRISDLSYTLSRRTAASAGEVLFPSNLTSLTSPCLGQHTRQPTRNLNPPSIAQPIPIGPRVAWVQHVLVAAGDPCGSTVGHCLDIVIYACANLGFNGGGLEIMRCFSSVTFAQPTISNTKYTTLGRRTALRPMRSFWRGISDTDWKLWLFNCLASYPPMLVRGHHSFQTRSFPRPWPRNQSASCRPHEQSGRTWCDNSKRGFDYR